MDANDRCLGDPHVAPRPPPAPTFSSAMYTEPVSCPLPQLTAAAPADLHHDPSRSSLPVVVAIPPPPATISLSCDPNFGYDSRELIFVDNDEAMEPCPNTTIGRLPNCDHVGVEGVLLDHEETNGFLKASSRGMTIQEFCFRARREVLECIPVGLDFCETFCSYGIKAMVIYCPRRPRMCVILGIHEVDEGAINALVVHRHIWTDIGFIECRKVGETPLGIIASLSPSRVSAKPRSCTFDPEGRISQHFARDWKKIEAFVGWKTTTIQMCYHPQEFKKVSEELGVLLGNFDVGECVPWLCWIMFGMRGRVTGVARNIVEFLEFEVREHIGEGKEGKKDFVDVLLELPRNERCGFALGDISIKALILDMFVVGSDKTFTLIEWTLSELIPHKRAKNVFFFMVDVLTLLQLCASSEHLHAIDPSGDNLPKIVFATFFILRWFPP